MPPRTRAKQLPNEGTLIAQARTGDKDAYRLLVEAYQDRLFGLVVSMVKNRELAEDLSQEIFVKAFFALSKFEGGSAFYTWLFRVASNHCLDHLRKRKLSETSLDATLDDNEETTRLQQMPAPQTDEPDRLMGAPTESGEILSSLTPEQRLILSLRELEGYSYEELADVMKCGVNTIKSRLNRAREALKAAYEAKYGNISVTETVEEKGEVT
jgi:RNA polymerase sigma-70 factor, ECF subfamily